MIPPQQHQRQLPVDDLHQGLDLTVSGDAVLIDQVIDGGNAGRGQLPRLRCARPVGGGRQCRCRLLQVGGVTALRAAGDPVLPRVGRAHELYRVAAPHVPAGRLDRDRRDAEPGEDPLVRAAVRLERGVQPGLIQVEAVGVLHGELPHPDQAALRPRLVPELELELVPELRQLAVGGQLDRQAGEDLLMRHAEDDIRALAVLQPEHLLAHHAEPAALLPDLRGLHRRQQELLRPDPVHLLPDHVHHLGPDPDAERQQAVVTRHQLADETGPDEQPMAGRVRIGRVLTQCRDVQL